MRTSLGCIFVYEDKYIIPPYTTCTVYIVSVLLCICIILVAGDAYAHSLFNSAEEFYGGYRVQVATTPEFPQIDEISTILIRVTDEDFEEVDSFTMGLRFFYNDLQVDAVPPQSHQGGHWDIDYIWKKEGNHIVMVDMYSVNGDDTDILTYTFNMGTQSPFGYIFISAITVGALTFTGIMTYIYLPKILRRR